jgi:hypothetical protein
VQNSSFPRRQKTQKLRAENQTGRPDTAILARNFSHFSVTSFFCLSSFFGIDNTGSREIRGRLETWHHQ